MRRLVAVVAFSAALAGPASAIPPIPPLIPHPEDTVCVQATGTCTGLCDLEIYCGPGVVELCAHETTTDYEACLPTGDDFPWDIVPYHP